MVLEKIIHVYPCTCLATALSSLPLIANYFGVLDLPNALGITGILTGLGVYFGITERENYELIGSIIRQEGLSSILQDKSFKSFHNTAKTWEKDNSSLLIPKTKEVLMPIQELKKIG